MTTAFDKLYVWMTYDGQRVIDMWKQPEKMDRIQYETYCGLCDKYGIDPYKNDHKANEFIDGLMFGDDGQGWIDHAKELGVIRKRTKEERIQQNRELVEDLN